MHTHFSAFIVLCSAINVLSLNEQVVTESDGNSINEKPDKQSSRFLSDHNTLSVSKEWALQFDEQLGRGDYMTEDKQMEIHNNLLEAAEILHIIPPGSKTKYTNLSWKLEGISEPTTAISIKSHDDDHNDLPVSVGDLRRNGVNTFPNIATNPGSSLSSQVQENRHDEEQEELQKVKNRVRKYSPRLRLAMYARAPSAIGRKIARKQARRIS